MIAPDNEQVGSYNEFEGELRKLLNRCNIDGLAATPDHLLAHYLRMCMENYVRTCRMNDAWKDNR